ncbi:AEC family transporter [Marinobacterium sp. YM272]|uniref:AEC family transporter n=1 Tax=Marinobacterium sp. YM272 TaxID=3421654 RepID=UPI003D7FFF80
MELYLQTLAFTGNIVAPIFLIMFIGYFLVRMGVFNENFVNVGSRFVFTVTLPTLVFLSIARMDYHATFNPAMLLFVLVATLISFGLIWWLGKRWIDSPEDLASFIQGAFRSNYGIIGLAVSFNLFGQAGLAEASLILALVIPMYNVLAIICLTVPLQKSGGMDVMKTAYQIIRNPLIIAVIIALPFSYFGLELPHIAERTARYFADITLPLALLTIGGSLNMKSLRSTSSTAFWATLTKLVLLPLILVPLAWLFGFSGQDMVMMMVLFGCPSAAAGFVMAKAMGANAQLAANIILTTTLGSVVTLSTGIFIVRFIGII